MAESGFRDRVRRVAFQRSFRHRDCTHLGSILHTNPERSDCEKCVTGGTPTVHLRMCLACGEVGCCDSSPAKHARGHYETMDHPLIRSIEPGEEWVWCYKDRAYLTQAPG